MCQTWHISTFHISCCVIVTIGHIYCSIIVAFDIFLALFICNFFSTDIFVTVSMSTLTFVSHTWHIIIGHNWHILMYSFVTLTYFRCIICHTWHIFICIICHTWHISSCMLCHSLTFLYLLFVTLGHISSCIICHIWHITQSFYFCCQYYNGQHGLFVIKTTTPMWPVFLHIQILAWSKGIVS